MKTRLIAVALVSATAALSSPAFAQDISANGPGAYGRSYAAPAAPAPHRMSTFRGAYNQTQTQTEPEFYNNGWIGEGAIDHSRPGGLDPDLRPAAN
jgi:hypothetical protein